MVITDAPEIVQLAAAQMEPSENPKAVAARTRFPQLSVVPSTSIAWLAEAHADGARKYGTLNWRDQPHSMSSLIDAAIRHLLALKEGEDHAEDSGLPHAAHVMAGMSVLLDASACGTLIDDRVEPRTDAWERVRDEIGAIRGRETAHPPATDRQQTVNLLPDGGPASSVLA